jgi:NAD(P)-dependent dehydrogenase (short-subunit alcohol dehydrogenase family)
MAMDMAGRVAIVTGGSQGLGMVAATRFAQRGAAVVVADVRPEGETVVRQIREGGGKALYASVDVTSEADVNEMIASTLREFGRLDFAYNNAGVLEERVLTAEIPVEEWNRIISVNLTGVWLCLRAEVPAMIGSAHGGAIVNCSSMAGLSGTAAWRMAAYASSKAGVIALTRAAARDYADQGVRVNAICPGGIETEMMKQTMDANPSFAQQLTVSKPMGRLGRPEEVADTVVWLCSNEASYISGIAVPIDGAAYQ